MKVTAAVAGNKTFPVNSTTPSTTTPNTNFPLLQGEPQTSHQEASGAHRGASNVVAGVAALALVGAAFR